MSENFLTARLRRVSGKGGARRLRLNGSIPGVYYAHNEANIHFAVGVSELRSLLRRRHTIVTLKIDGDEPRPSVIRELQRDPVDDHLIHIDLLGVHSGERIAVRVPVKLVGIAAGVKEGSGILEHGLSELSVECLPADIPEVVTVDVTPLGVGHSVHVRDLRLPNVRVLDDPHALVAHVAAPTLVREAVAGAAEGGEAAEPAVPKAD